MSRHEESAQTLPRRRSGPARRLTRDMVVDAALEVMRTHGLDAVSFRTVALKLGVDPKALYTYVDDKDDLLAGMFDRNLAALGVPGADDSRPALDQLVGVLVSLRKILILNPDTLRLFRPMKGAEVFMDLWEKVATLLSAIDPDPQVALRVWLRLIHFTIGSATYAALLSQGPPSASAAGFLAKLDSARHAHLLELADQTPFVEDDLSFAGAARVMLQQRIGER